MCSTTVPTTAGRSAPRSPFWANRRPNSIWCTSCSRTPEHHHQNERDKSMSATIYDTPDHELLRDQVSRFLAREVEPHAAAWEDTGMVPRDVLRRMGQAGLLGIAFEGEYGGADADALTNLVFAEALSQSTFAGFIITVLVHTDMAGPHLHHAGTPAQKAKYMPRVTAGELITAVGISEP